MKKSNSLRNGLDSRDWAPGSNDSYNQFSGPGVVNPVTGVDIRLMDVLGYDPILVPEPATGTLLVAAGTIGAFLRRRKQS